MDDLESFTSDDLKIDTPARIFFSGPSGSGKTSFIKDFLCNSVDVFNHPVKNIVFCYGVDQPMYSEMRELFHGEIKFVYGFPSYIEDYLNNRGQHDLLIVDDLIEEVSESKQFLKYYMKLSHHWNFSIITLTQNLFFKSTHLRSCSLQASAFFLFKTRRGLDQIQTIGRQLFPTNPNFLLESFKKATRGDFGYLFVNLSPRCPDILRIRGNILPQKKMIVYNES